MQNFNIINNSKLIHNIEGLIIGIKTYLLLRYY